jgi:3'-5' exoribonuclease
MKQFFVKDVPNHENQVITSSFLVSSKQIKPKKSGDIYLSLVLCDRTGQLEAKMWDNVADAVDCFEQDDFLKVRGLINKYSNRYQLTLHKVRRMEEAEVEYSDYLPKTDKDVDALWRTVGEYIASFQNEYLKALLEAFMGDPQIAEAYRQAPAAKSLHHAFIGGLLDHVVSLMKLCETVAPLYPQINRDLLLTGAFLHDIGKIYELNYQKSFSYTTKGQLLGHMIIELEMLHEKITLVPNFPPELKVLIEHLIISHHGKYEFGSPKLPMFPEALMLHYLDDLDSKMESMRSHFEREPDAEWTGYNGSLGRTLLNSQKVLAKLASIDQTPAETISPDPEQIMMKAVAGEGE